MGICNSGGGALDQSIVLKHLSLEASLRGHILQIFKDLPAHLLWGASLQGVLQQGWLGPLKTHLTRGQRWRTWGWCGRSAACSPARPASPPPRHSSAGETDQQSDETNDSNKNLESVESNGPDEPHKYEKTEDLTYRVIFLTGHP